MSTANYLLGMIYMYHAEGLGRRSLARGYFEKAIEWNAKNYVAYLELARVFAELRFSNQASEVLQRLLKLDPPEETAFQARSELSKLSASSQ
jgi:tetratricopeptide (TPR) repeat protein